VKRSGRIAAELRKVLDRPEWEETRARLLDRSRAAEPAGDWNGLLRALETLPRLRLRPALRRYHLDRLKVLDVGCAYGCNVPFFGPNSFGVEIEPSKVAAGLALGLSIANCDVLSESFFEVTDFEGYDAIWSYAVIEHVAEPHTFLMRLRSRLKDSGLLLLGAPTIPANPRLAIVGQALMRHAFGARLDFSYQAADHVNAFTTRTLAFMVERAGFDIDYAGPMLCAGELPDRLVAPLARLFLDDECLIVARRRPNFEYPVKATRRRTDRGWEYRGSVGGLKP
jgi:SAM-dependent methyltransferase